VSSTKNIPEDKLKLPFYNAETGERAGTATLEGEVHFSRIIQAGEDKYLMVDPQNWEIARKNCPGCMHFRFLDEPKQGLTELKTIVMKARQIGVTAALRGYPVIELGNGLFAVPDIHTEELCAKFPQNP
jgi:hypothetical protein